jgi:hypothetical protein
MYFDNGDCQYRFDNRGMDCLIGRRIVVDNNGRYDHGTIVEVLPNMRFGAHLDGYMAYGKPVTVDLRRSEFALPKRGF